MEMDRFEEAKPTNPHWKLEEQWRGSLGRVAIFQHDAGGLMIVQEAVDVAVVMLNKQDVERLKKVLAG